MNIAQLISNRFNSKSVSNHRMLNSDPSEGAIGSGFMIKNSKTQSNINLQTKSYHGVLILSGHGIYKDANSEVPLKPGDFIQRFPGNIHSSIITDDNWAEVYVVIGKSLFRDLSSLNVMCDSQPVLHPGVDFETIQSFLNFHDQLGFADHLELPLLVPQLISYLARIRFLDRTNQPNTEEKNILMLATKYIHENINKRITVHDIAVHVDMGYEKFRKLFTEHYHISPGNYIINNRIFNSQKLLTNSELSIKEIAYQLGYVDAYTFSKQFKKITGRSPSDFQQLYLLP